MSPIQGQHCAPRGGGDQGLVQVKLSSLHAEWLKAGLSLVTGLERELSAVHINRMVEKSRTGLLEVAVFECDATSWEWQVCSGDAVLVRGFENTRMGAQFAGNDALFVLLAEGSPPEIPHTR